jgi:hypothetical protein
MMEVAPGVALINLDMVGARQVGAAFSEQGKPLSDLPRPYASDGLPKTCR